MGKTKGWGRKKLQQKTGCLSLLFIAVIYTLTQKQYKQRKGLLRNMIGPSSREAKLGTQVGTGRQ